MGPPKSAELALQAEVRVLRERIAELENERAVVDQAGKTIRLVGGLSASLAGGASA